MKKQVYRCGYIELVTMTRDQYDKFMVMGAAVEITLLLMMLAALILGGVGVWKGTVWMKLLAVAGSAGFIFLCGKVLCWVDKTLCAKEV